MEQHYYSKTSDLEWWMVIGFTFLFELGQIVLNFLMGAGLAFNRLLSVGLGIGIGFWLHLRGGGLNNPKKWTSFIGAFIGEEVPIADSFFFWTTTLLVQKYVWNTPLKQVAGHVVK